ACTAKDAVGEGINVANGGRVTPLELIRALQVILCKEVEPVFAPAREGDVRDSQADVFKARQLLGYSPGVSFGEGLRRTVNWYKTSMAVADAECPRRAKSTKPGA